MPKDNIPEQELPIIDPNLPATNARYSYYLLEEPNSPSVAPPNALRVVQYKRRQFLHDDPDDFRRPYGFVEYERKLTFKEIADYNLLPFERDDISLFDLWLAFEQDKARMTAYFTQYFKIITGDPERERLRLANKLIAEGWDLKRIRKAIKGIK